MPKRTDIRKILIIGSGPIVIGQACEFDYSGTQACRSLKDEGYEVVLVNSNPATIMTDPEIADRTYIEPLTLETVAAIIETGFLNLDREILTKRTDLIAQGVVEGVLCFATNENIEPTPISNMTP